VAGRFPSPDALLGPSCMARAAHDPDIRIEPAWKVSLVYGMPCAVYHQFPAAYYLAARFRVISSRRCCTRSMAAGRTWPGRCSPARWWGAGGSVGHPRPLHRRAGAGEQWLAQARRLAVQLAAGIEAEQIKLHGPICSP
jgi:hypothetical protein